MKCKNCGHEIYELYSKGTNEWEHFDIIDCVAEPEKECEQKK